MTPHDLLANFEVLAEAPNGIQRLRELVLELAVQGKLVPQNPEDEPASAQIERILSQKSETGRSERNIKIRVLEPSADNANLPMPQGWTRVALADLVTVLNGRAYSKNELLSSGTPVLRVGNLFTSNHWYYSDLQLEPNKYCDEGDLLYAWSASFGPFIWSGPKAIYHYHIWKLELHREEDQNKYFLFWFLHNKTQEIKQAGHGVSMLHMTKEKMEKLEVLLPPLAEQSRIVACVDELMALLERLEGKRKEREAARTAARDSALAAIREAPTPDDVETAWLRIQERFHELFTTPEDVEPLRALTLELAVRGKLVEQDQEDEPASNLLIRAKARKSTLPGSSRHGRTLPPKEAERPFDLPEGWSWAQMDDFCDIKSGVAKGKNLQGIECHHFPYLRVANVQAGYTDLAVMKTIPLPVAELDTYRLVKGDVLLTEGGDWDKLGRSAVWGGEIDPCIHQNHVFRARSLEQGIHPRWISSFTNSPDGRAYFQSCSKQTTNLASINMSQLKGCLVPIPPSAEQDRILARMDELMALLERLSESLSGQSRLAQAFAAAAVHHLDA